MHLPALCSADPICPNGSDGHKTSRWKSAGLENTGARRGLSRVPSRLTALHLTRIHDESVAKGQNVGLRWSSPCVGPLSEPILEPKIESSQKSPQVKI